MASATQREVGTMKRQRWAGPAPRAAGADGGPRALLRAVQRWWAYRPEQRYMRG